MADKISVLLSEQEVNERIAALGAAISKDYEGKQVHLICILKGSVYIVGGLVSNMVELVFI